MINYLIPRLENLIDALRRDLNLIARKKKDDEWKRDHYRYTFTIHVQRIYRLLNSSLTEKSPAKIQKSTKDELIVLRDILNDMIEET